MKITIINTGGTFNKIYEPIKGKLEVPANDKCLDKIISSCHNIEFEIKNIISKDSEYMDDNDRQAILNEIKNDKNDKIIVIHGTDTMHLTSTLIKEKKIAKQVVFTGSMIPMSIDTIEATMNFSQALGFLNANVQNGTYISMHGAVTDCSKLIKNRKLGQFLLKE